MSEKAISYLRQVKHKAHQLQEYTQQLKTAAGHNRLCPSKQQLDQKHRDRQPLKLKQLPGLLRCAHFCFSLNPHRAHLHF